MKRLRHLQNRKASVTAFVAIVLASVCLLNCVLLDLARGISFRRYAQARVDLACDSILASFDSLLAAKYGLYGVNRVRAGDVEETFGTYIGISGGVGFVDFKDFDLVYKEVRLTEPLSDPSVLRGQIVDQMRIRTPVRGAAWLLEQLGIIENAEGMGRSALYVAQGDELLLQAEEKLNRLQQLTEGTFQGDTLCVNGYVQALRNYIELEPFLATLGILSGQDDHFVEQVIAEHRKLRVLITTYYDLHRESIVLVRELQLLADEIRALITEVQNGSASAVSESGVQEMLLKLKNKVGIISNTTNLSKLETNANLLWEKIQGLDSNLKVLEDIDTLCAEEDALSAFTTHVQNALSTNGIWDQFAVFTIRESSALRTEAVPCVEGKTETQDKDSFEIPVALYHTLPSVEAEIEPENALLSVDFSGLDHLVPLFKDGLFRKPISSVVTQAYEELLINDYVLCYFGNGVSAQSSTYFQEEMEYILGGHASVEENLEIVEEKLLLLRFALNLTHILRDQDKCALAKEMGRAIAVAVSGGVGGTLYAVLVMCAWSATESYQDVTRLREGKCIPLIKKKDDWRTSIEGLLSNDADSGEETQGLSYTDYLMILLAMEDGEAKLYRIADVIEMNMTHQTGLRYRLSAVYTRVRGGTKYQPSYIAFDLLRVIKKEDYVICVEGEQTYGT